MYAQRQSVGKVGSGLTRRQVELLERRRDFPQPWLSLIAVDQTHQKTPSSSALVPFAGMLQHPVAAMVSHYRWGSPVLASEARRIALSMFSADGAGWHRQVETLKKELLQTLDKDRLERVFNSARSFGIPVEHVGRGPAISQPFKVTYQRSEWLIHPMENWKERIPLEAHLHKLLLEQTGIRFDTWHIAEELPKPTLGDRARQAAKVTGILTGGVALGIAMAVGAVLAGLAQLDPALVGTLESKAEPGRADWFIISRWLH